MTLLAGISEGVLIAACAAGGAFAREGFEWIKGLKADRRADKAAEADAATQLVQAGAAFQKMLNDACEAQMAGMRDEVAAARRDASEARAEIGRLNQEIARLHEAHLECQADSIRLGGELANERQARESLTRFLKRRGIDVPDLGETRPLIILEAQTAPAGEAAS